MSQFENYYEYIENEARSFVDEYKSELFEEIKDGNTDVHRFVDDSRAHEWVDNDFIYADLHDCANILEQSNNIEEDFGLWENEQPIDAIKTQAFFTYRNDLSKKVMEIIEDELENKLDELELRLEQLKQEFKQTEDGDILEDINSDIFTIEEFADYIEEALDRI